MDNVLEDVDMISVEEAWLPVVGHEEQYVISTLGRIRNSRRDRDLKATANKSGYLTVQLSREGVATTYRLHRLVLATFVGPCPEGAEGCHNDGNRVNNALGNLRWDTHSSNMYDLTMHRMHSREGECGHGHVRDEWNTRLRLNSGRRIRVCRECEGIHRRAARKARRLRAKTG